MEGRKKILLYVIGCLALLFSLFVGFALFLPYLINLEPLKEKILDILSQRLEWKVGYERVDLSYFPQPRVKIHQVSLLIPEKADGIIKSVEVYPELLAIFKGKVRVHMIQVESPKFNIRLSKEHDAIKEKTEANVLEEITEKIARTSMIVPKMKVIIEDGRLNLFLESKLISSFSDLDASIICPPDTAKMEITCSSNLWEKMSLEATLNSVEGKGNGHIEVKNFYPHALSNSLFPSIPFAVRDSWLNLKINFKIERQNVLQAEVEGSIPMLTFRKDDKDVVVKGDRLEGTFRMEGKKIGIDLKELNLEDPQLKLSGTFRMDPTVPHTQVELEGRDVDVVSTRKMILTLIGKDPSIQTLFDCVQGGNVPQVSLKFSGRSISDLGRTESMEVRGRMTDGHVLIPISLFGESLDLRRVRGEVVISRGILEAKNTEAQWKDNYVRVVQLRMGLQGKDAPFHMEGLNDTDFSKAFPLLKRILKEKGVLQEIAKIKKLEGRARSAFVLGGTMNSITVKTSFQDIRLVAQYGRIPFPLVIDGGQSSYDWKKISFQNLKGKIGRSSFSGLTAELRLEREPYLEIQSGECSVMLDELYPWVLSHGDLKRALKDIKSPKGIVRLSRIRLKGPLFKPKNWHFETVGEWRDLTLNTSIVPGTITSRSGKFRADPKRISLSDVHTNLLNASVNFSGTVDAYLNVLEKVEMDIDGKVTPKDIQWLSEFLKLTKETHINSSIDISGAHLLWKKGEYTSFRGNLTFEKGPQIYLDLIQKPDQLKVDRLAVRDETSDCVMMVDLQDRTVNVGFSGELSEKTLDKILSGYQFQNGWLKGDFRATLLMDKLMQSTIQGRLEADDLSFPWQLEKPLEIDHISLTGHGNHISIAEARFIWGEMPPFVLSGLVGFSEKRILLDVDLSTASVDLDQVTKSLSKGKKDKGVQDLSDLQLQGTIRFKSNSFKYERFLWEPFRADIKVGQIGVEVNIEEARLCGISTPGVVKMIDQELSIDIRPVFRGREFERTAKCLLGQEIRATGDFELKGRIVGQGKPEDLFRSSRGDLEFRAKDGRIYYAIGLSRILEFISVTEIYRGKLPDLKREGFPYELISVKGSLQNGRFVIKEATLDGPTMEMAAQGEIDLKNQRINATFLVAPMKTIDRIIKLIPLIRDIFAGTLVTIPVRVSGDLKDPKVNPVSPSAIGSELFAMMKRTLGLPFKLLNPFMPLKKEKNEDER